MFSSQRVCVEVEEKLSKAKCSLLDSNSPSSEEMDAGLPAREDAGQRGGRRRRHRHLGLRHALVDCLCVTPDARDVMSLRCWSLTLCHSIDTVVALMRPLVTFEEKAVSAASGVASIYPRLASPFRSLRLSLQVLCIY